MSRELSAGLAQKIIAGLVSILMLTASGWVAYVWGRMGQLDERLRILEAHVAAAEQRQDGLVQWQKSYSERLRVLEQRGH